MNLPLRFASRYLVSKKTSNAINIISWVSILGMLVGSLGLILVLSVFNGFQSLVISLYDKFSPDYQITAQLGKSFYVDSARLVALQRLKGVQAVSEVVQENALLNYNGKQFLATVKGVKNDYGHLMGIDSAIAVGIFNLKEEKQNEAVLGIGIAQALGVNYDDPLAMMSVYVPKKTGGVVLNPEDAFNVGIVKPAGSFAIQADFDNKYVFVPLDFARQLTGLRWQQVTSVEVLMKRGMANETIQHEIETIFGNSFVIQNRLEQNSTLYKVMKTEKWAVYAILTFILIVAAFNIIGSLSLLVIEKKKDISILKAMGAEEKLVQGIFLYEGFLLSFVGCMTGFFLAAVIILLQQHFQFIKITGGSFVVDAYPVEMQWPDFLLVFCTVIAIGLFAAWIPARRAARAQYALVEE